MRITSDIRKILRKKAFLGFFLFFFFLTACSTNSEQFAPNSIESSVVKFFLDKAQVLQQLDYRIFYEVHFNENFTYTMRTNSHLYEESQEKEGSYEYTRRSNRKALITCTFSLEDGKRVSYTTYLRFEDPQSGTWETTGSPAFPQGEGGSFMIIRPKESK